MSFRLRVLALIVFVTVTATAATAWLTLRIATQQAQQTFSAGEQDLQQITSALTRFGRENDSWHDVSSLVSQLTIQTGQRIRLETESGRVLADSDELAGTPPRPVAGAPLVIDARPVLQLPTQLLPGGVSSTHAGGGVKMTAVAIAEYHRQHWLKRCLIDAGLTVTTYPGSFGLEMVLPGTANVESIACKQLAESDDEDFMSYVAAAEACTPLAESAMRDCFQQAFWRHIAATSAEPLRVYIGVSADRRAPVPVMPVAVAATLVALTVLIGVLLLSRHVLRPIRALTSAANRLGEGRLNDRVPVAGHDELAMLSRAFNRMAQALADSEERQRRMTADIAHELRTPLTNLRGYLEALTDGTAAPSRDLFLSLRDEALLQQRIIDDLQDLALAEAGQLTYRKARVDVSELVETYPPAHFAADVGIVAITSGPAYVTGDPDRLRQTLNNLVRNAVVACGPSGMITLTARRDGPWTELMVADTGAGIRPEDLPHVFDRFWRADRARPRGSGAGLGLAIVRQIVTDHGGTVAVTSEPGRGTTFILRLPAG